MGGCILKDEKREEEPKKKAKEGRGGVPHRRSISDNPQAHNIKV